MMSITLSLVGSAAWVSAQQYRALTMILQSLKTQTMISEMPSLCHIACASKAYQILSPLLFQQSLYFSLSIHRIFYLLVSVLFLHALQYISTCFWPLFHLEQRSFAPPKKWRMSARRRMRARISSCAAGTAVKMHQEDHLRLLRSKKTASRPKPCLED